MSYLKNQKTFIKSIKNNWIFNQTQIRSNKSKQSSNPLNPFVVLIKAKHNTLSMGQNSTRPKKTIFQETQNTSLQRKPRFQDTSSPKKTNTSSLQRDYTFNTSLNSFNQTHFRILNRGIKG